MKITVWIRPDQRGNIDRDIVMRIDAKYESLDTPAIQYYGRKLLAALEGCGEGSQRTNRESNGQGE